MKNLSVLLLAGSALSAISPAYAETTVPQIVVSATRSPTDIRRIASSVTVITAEDIEQQNKPTVTELLRRVPGISIANSGGTGQSTRLFMRGTNSEHVLVLIDGVAVNDPSDPADAFDFSNLTTDNIAQIEILRGPQSTLYGSQAIGGVINIITNSGSGKPATKVLAEYGRYNSAKIKMENSGEVGKTSYSMSVGQSHTDGISSFDKRYGGIEKDPNHTTTLSANIASRLMDNFTAKLTARFNRSVSDFDSPGSFGVGGARPDDDRFPNSDSRQFNGRAAGELSLLGGNWLQELGASSVDFNRGVVAEFFDSGYTPYFGRQQYLGMRRTIDWVHHVKLIPDHVVTAGAEISSESFKKNSDIEPLSAVNIDNRAAFINDQYSINTSAFVNYGGRIDDHQAFGRQWTWKVAPGYRIEATNTLLKATYGTGFKAPSLSQLYDPASGNPRLNPEKSKGYDVGFEQSLWKNKVTVGATAFRNNIENLIGFAAAPLYKSNNNKARTEGIESALSFQPSAQWGFYASHTYTLSLDRKNNIELLRRPKHEAEASAQYRYSSRGDVEVNARYVGLSRDYDYLTSSFKKDIKAYGTLNLTSNYDVSETLTLYGRLDNLLDKRYEEIDGYGQPGRGLYIGAKAKF